MTPSRTPRAPLDVDDRIGSRELLHPLRRMGLPVRLRRLAFADFAFTGHGPAGPVRVGVERKTVSEIFGCITDSRFTGHQLPGLIDAYDAVWLIVEGPARVDPRSGLLMIGRHEVGAGFSRVRTMYSTYRKFLTTIAVKGGVHVQTTGGFVETQWAIASVYEWWQARWASHQSAYHVEEAQADAAILSERTYARRVAAQLPGVGWVRSKAVSEAFGSIAAMTAATAEEWQRALGIAKGRATAERLVRVCSGKERTR